MKSVALDLVNRLVLHKHYLTHQSKGEDIVTVATDICGLHATSPTTPYLSLFARVENFSREHLHEQLYVERALAKIRCFRTTVYILPKHMMPAAFAATKRMVQPMSEQYSRRLGVTEEDYQKTSEQIMVLLLGRAVTASEIRQELNTRLNVSAIVNLMCDQGLLIRGVPRGSWRSNLHTYSRFDEHFPDISLDRTDETEAKKSIVKHYIGAFGPVTEKDIAWWTGFPMRQSKDILERLQSSTIQLEILGLHGSHVMLASGCEALDCPIPTLEPMVSLLPSLDSYIMGYKERERYLGPENRRYVFDRSGNATSTILISGRIAGIWDFIEPSVALFLFDALPTSVSEIVEDKAKQLGEFISEHEVRVEWREMWERQRISNG